VIAGWSQREDVAWRGGVSNVDRDENNAFQIKGIGVVISPIETLPAGEDGALHADAGLPCEEGDASGLGLFSGPPGVHMAAFHVLLQWYGFPTQRLGLRAPLDG